MHKRCNADVTFLDLLTPRDDQGRLGSRMPTVDGRLCWLNAAFGLRFVEPQGDSRTSKGRVLARRSGLFSGVCLDHGLVVDCQRPNAHGVVNESVSGAVGRETLTT
jgi:hypothetical protein